MMKKAERLGLEMNAKEFSKYSALDSKQALSDLHKSWNPFWLFPNDRKIADNSSLSNSVILRCECEEDYRPKNLIWNNGELPTSYQIHEILSPFTSLA